VTEIIGQNESQAGHESAHARRGRRRQERLTRLAAPWWTRYPEVLAAEIRALQTAGFRVHQTAAPGSGLVLQCDRSGERFDLHFGHNYLQGGLVVAFPKQPDVTGRPGDRRVAYGHGPGEGLPVLERLIAGPAMYTPASGNRVVLPLAWDLLRSGKVGAISFGRSRSGRAFVPLGLTGAANAKALGASSCGFARAFPDPVSGLWATGTWLTETEHPTEAIVHDAEEQLARAHGLELTTVRSRLHREVGAIAVRSRDSLVDWHFVSRSLTGIPMVMPVEFYYPRSYVDRAPFATRLTSKSVLIVGCGAVGWSVGTLLARSGVRSFALFDDDALHLGNLARVGAFLESAGHFKVTALAEQLETIAPGIEARALSLDVGRTGGTLELVEAQPDLLINLTGEERSTEETNLAALILDRPAIFAWVSMGVVAGRIFRVRPGKSACYECVREYGPIPIPSDGFTPAPGERPWEGSVLDTTAFAAAVARSAVLTLIGDPVSATNPDHIVLNFDGGFVPTSQSVAIARDRRCSRCGS